MERYTSQAPLGWAEDALEGVCVLGSRSRLSEGDAVPCLGCLRLL